MKIRTTIAALSVFGGLASGAMGQGLLSIGGVDIDSDQGFTTTVGLGGGYDSIDYGSGPQVDSAFVTGGAGIANGWGSKVSRYNASAQGNVIYYFDGGERINDTFYNARIQFAGVHEVNRRLKLGGNIYAAYEYEPDYAIGASTGLVEGQYLYGNAHVDAAYQWNRRLSTVTGYTFYAISYDDQDVAASEDRMSHIFSQEARFAFSRTTTGLVEYRFQYTDFDSIRSDYHSNYALIGIDHAFSDTTTLGIKGGAEWRNSDSNGDQTRPYLEAALKHKVSRRTGVRWYNWLGLDDSDLGVYRDRYSYRTGIIADTQITEKLNAYGGIHYVYSQLEGGKSYSDTNENQGNIGIGLSYSLNQNWALNANYGFTIISSDDPIREYERNRVTVGVTGTF